MNLRPEAGSENATHVTGSAVNRRNCATLGWSTSLRVERLYHPGNQGKIVDVLYDVTTVSPRLNETEYVTNSMHLPASTSKMRIFMDSSGDTNLSGGTLLRQQTVIVA